MRQRLIIKNVAGQAWEHLRDKAVACLKRHPKVTEIHLIVNVKNLPRGKELCDLWVTGVNGPHHYNWNLPQVLVFLDM